MKVIKAEYRLCTCCMEEHEVKTVLINEKAAYKGKNINYDATYYYCDLAEELYADEELIQSNDILLKDVYRRSEGLLTAEEIVGIRCKYGISQSDLCTILGWGGKTISRYETHQVQDKAHDTILRKLDQDPEWFLSLLNEARNALSDDSYRKYCASAAACFENDKDSYLRKAIEASYAKYRDKPLLNGNTVLSLNKAIDMIRYFASSASVSNLYKVKLMKLMWYADALSYKTRGHAISGLVYTAMPMGAVPIGHNSIIDLNGVPCEEVEIGETNAYHFSLNEKDLNSTLSQDDIDILEIVINHLGKMSKSEIVSFMHKEQAYIETAPKDEIQFKYALALQI